jgi:hypothetical protein
MESHRQDCPFLLLSGLKNAVLSSEIPLGLVFRAGNPLQWDFLTGLCRMRAARIVALFHLL